MKFFAHAVALLFFCAANAQASDALDVGDAMPLAQLQDQYGQKRSFDSLKGNNGLVLVFIRSVEWCPYCQKQILSLNSYLSDFQNAGYNVATVSYDADDKITRFAAQHRIDMPLLSDQASYMIRAAGILDTTQSEGSRTYGIPKPTIYVVNRDGIITAVLAEEGYKNRPDIQDVFAALER